jgi:hypothetical protein
MILQKKKSYQIFIVLFLAMSGFSTKGAGLTKFCDCLKVCDYDWAIL